MIKVQVIYWRDIPVRIRVKNGRIRHTTPLSPRFQQAVYRAAYRAKAISGDAYVNEWRVADWQPGESDADGVETAVITELEAAFSDQLLDTLAKNKGFMEK